MRASPQIAVAMLVRNLIAQPGVMSYVRDKIDPSYLPNSDNSSILRAMMDISVGAGRLNEGMIEEVLFNHPNQQFSRPLRLRAVAEDKEAIDQYLASLEEFAESERLRVLIANVHIDLSDADVDVERVKRDLAAGLIGTRRSVGLRDISHYAAEAEEMLIRARSGDRPGRSVGFGADLDKYWWLDPGAVSIVAGRPGSGKTSLITSSIMTSASPDRPEAFFSIEMPGFSIAQRIASAVEKVPLSDLMQGKATYEQFEKTVNRLHELSNRGIYVDEDVVTMDDILYRCMAMPVSPTVVWIDYGEKVEVDRDRRGRRDLELGEIYTRAKTIAKRLRCHVVVLAQLGRDVEQRADKWPQMSDISQSGAAEKDGDYVVLLMRPEYYFSRGQQCRLLMETDRSGVAYVIVAKSRNGATETVRVRYETTTMSFDEYGTEAYYYDDQTD